MSNVHLLSIIVAYFLLLLALAAWTGRHATNESFFIGNRKSNWALVAFGMVGDFDVTTLKSNEVETEVRSKMKHVQEGSRTWEVEYKRIMADVQRRKGLT